MRLRSRLGKPLLLLVPMVLLTGCDLNACLPQATMLSGAGVVKVANPPASVTPGQELTLDLKGSYLNTQCVYLATTIWGSQSSYARGYHDKDQDSALFNPPKNCNRFDRTITVTVPADFAGGKLYVRLSARAEQTALGFMSTGTYETAETSFDVAATPTAPAANTAPTARVFAHYLRMDPVLAALRTIDARTSTDPEGQALTYSWDVNCDGVYGDPVEETGTAGVVQIPALALPAQGAALRFGVKVTDTGGLSGTATCGRAEVIGTQPDTTQALAFTPITGVVGSPTTVTFTPTSNIALACFDTNGDGRYTDATATAAPWSATFTPSAAGTQQIGVILATGVNPDCTQIDTQFASGIFPFQQGVADAYVSAAARSARTTTGYRAKARFTLSGATMIGIGTAEPSGAMSGTAGRGTYTLRTPAKGNGATRPAGLQSFTRGDYVIRAASLDFVATARTRQTLIGQSTMLLRGTDGALACLAVTGTPSSSTYVFIGGTGPAARLTGDATSTNLSMRVKPTKAKSVSYKGKRQRKPIRSNATIAAGTAAKATPLPAACAALKRHLP